MIHIIINGLFNLFNNLTKFVVATNIYKKLKQKLMKDIKKLKLNTKINMYVKIHTSYLKNLIKQLRIMTNVCLTIN